MIETMTARAAAPMYSPVAPPGAEAPMTLLVNAMMWLGGICFVLAFVALGILMVLDAHGRGPDGGIEDLVKNLVRIIVGGFFIGGAGGLGVYFGV